MSGEFTHFDARGAAHMVDVSGKAVTSREACAQGQIKVGQQIIQLIQSGNASKGDVLGVARLAGIMAAKRTSELIPLCHPLPLTRCAVDFDVEADKGLITARCTVSTDGKTGVEMEALTGVSVALLTIYDMCKAVDKGMVMSEIRLLRKSGGKSGDYHAQI